MSSGDFHRPGRCQACERFSVGVASGVGLCSAVIAPGTDRPDFSHAVSGPGGACGPKQILFVPAEKQCAA